MEAYRMLGLKINLVKKSRELNFLDKQRKLISVYNTLQLNSISPNEAGKHSIKIAMDGVKRSGIEVLSQKGVTLDILRKIWVKIPQYEQSIDKQVEIDAHYSVYLKKQSHDVATFKKDEAILIPEDIDYDSFSSLSNEIKSKLKLIKPKTLGQALRIDGVTPAAAIILLAFIKKKPYKASA